MSYTRVIPRDFFNESKLLKCMGQLALKILDREAPYGLEIQDSGDRFLVEQDPSDGGLYVDNYRIIIHGKSYRVKTTYNSKSPFPLILEDIDFSELYVFEKDGSFTGGFLAFCENRKPKKNE
jgi:hypothetical protein